MDREVVETFLAIADLKTISGAADTLYVSQSTVSHRLNSLEDYLNAQLFERQRGFKVVTLTQAGEVFLPLAHQWLDLDDKLRNINTERALYNINIAGMDSVNQYLLTSVLPQIRLMEPSLNMYLRSFHSKDILRMLNNREIDIGFAYYPVRYNDIMAFPVFQEPVYMISSPESEYDRPVIHPNELRKSDEIYYSWAENLVQWHNEWWPTYEAPYVKVDSCGLLQNFFILPQNWAMCPASVASELYALKLVKRHRFAVDPPARVCYMLIKKAPKGSSNKGVELFVAAFNQLLKKHPWHYSEEDISLS